MASSSPSTRSTKVFGVRLALSSPSSRQSVWSHHAAPFRRTDCTVQREANCSIARRVMTIGASSVPFLVHQAGSSAQRPS